MKEKKNILKIFILLILCISICIPAMASDDVESDFVEKSETKIARIMPAKATGYKDININKGAYSATIRVSVKATVDANNGKIISIDRIDVYDYDGFNLDSWTTITQKGTKNSKNTGYVDVYVYGHAKFSWTEPTTQIKATHTETIDKTVSIKCKV